MKKIVALIFMTMLLGIGVATAGVDSGVSALKSEKGELPGVINRPCPPYC